ncbi:hypothetical protein BCVP_CDS0230 [Bacillus phage BC-VP]|nr:hypothetical protein BCVP_CDS0230 [Bacillus phage BC-VP]
MNKLMDKVKCNWCEKESLVNFDEDVCPHCKEDGYLMDIEQDIEVE